jgi:predicted nucleic acid-binding protein
MFLAVGDVGGWFVGGRVHDYLHAVAAQKSGAKKLLTLDENDFNDLTKVEIEQV